MSGDLEMRVSDADRAAVAERLRLALDEGRLDLADFDERLGAAYSATTVKDLVPLTADLPAVVLTKKDDEVAARKESWAEWRNEWTDWAGGAVIMIAIWATTSLVNGQLNAFWPAIPLGIWAAVLLASALGGGDAKNHRKKA